VGETYASAKHDPLTISDAADARKGRDERAGPAMNLSLTVSSTGARNVLEVRGEVDLHSAPQLQDRLLQLIGPGQPSVVVDLTGLSFLDSTGLGVLVAARNEAERAGTALKLVCSSDRMLKLFRITGLDAAFEIYATVAGAIGSG
jgi:anti-sigma B factor antagonist